MTWYVLSFFNVSDYFYLNSWTMYRKWVNAWHYIALCPYILQLSPRVKLFFKKSSPSYWNVSMNTKALIQLEAKLLCMFVSFLVLFWNQLGRIKPLLFGIHFSSAIRITTQYLKNIFLQSIAYIPHFVIYMWVISYCMHEWVFLTWIKQKYGSRLKNVKKCHLTGLWDEQLKYFIRQVLYLEVFPFQHQDKP